MRISHLVYIVVPVALFWSAGAVARTHFSWNPHCTVTQQHVINVGDQPGHTLAVTQFKCESTNKAQIGTDQLTTGVATVTNESWGSKGRDSNGWQIVTTENGDRVSLPYHGVSTSKDGKLTEAHGTFEFTDGTGKLKGITGKGRYTCMPAGDGIDCKVTGEYHMK